MAGFDTVDNFNREWKKECKRRERKRKLEKVKTFIRENKHELMVLAPIAAGGTAFLVKSGIRSANLRKAEKVKNLYCYDRSLGHYWKLRRELSNDEWLRIDRRKRSGEKLADILAEMRVLK